MHILDIAENSVKAGATLIESTIEKEGDILTITVKDNGKGMSREFLEKATDPFTTTRTTRKVGLGIPLLKMASENAGGSFKIESELGKGTIVRAMFDINHIDRMPLGNIAETITALLNPDTDFLWTYRVDGREFSFDTREAKEELGGVPIDNPEVLIFLKSYLKEHIESINGGINL